MDSKLKIDLSDLDRFNDIELNDDGLEVLQGANEEFDQNMITDPELNDLQPLEFNISIDQVPDDNDDNDNEIPIIDDEDDEDDYVDEDELETYLSYQPEDEDNYIRIEPIRVLNYGYYNSTELYYSELKKTIASKFPDFNIYQKTMLFQNIKDIDLGHKSINMILVSILLCNDCLSAKVKLTPDNYDKFFSKYQEFLLREMKNTFNREITILEYKAILLNYIIYVVNNVGGLNPF